MGSTAVSENLTKMQRTALAALEPLVFPRISTEIALVLAAAVDGILSQPVTGSVVSTASFLLVLPFPTAAIAEGI